MTRHYDWSPLNRESDPVPGDPTEVLNASTKLADTADAIQKAVTGIRNVAGGDASSLGKESKALDEFRSKAEDVAEKLEKAKPRYEVAAKAMKTYHYALDGAQDLSLEALRDAETARDDQTSASSTMDANTDDQGSQAYKTAKGEKEAADAALSRAIGKLEDAISDRDDAADKAKNDIHNKIDDDEVKDSFWDDMSGFADVLSDISTILGIAALLVNCIPVIGQALSAILGAAALITGALALVLHLGAAIDNGEGWDAVLFDAIGVATFGIGRAFTAGAKGLSLASRTMAWGKLSRMSGPVASRLSSGAFAFASKGPMTKGMARTILTKGPLAGRNPLSVAFGPRGIAGDMASSWRTIKAGGWSGAWDNLMGTPSNVANMFRSTDGAGNWARVFQGEDGLSTALSNVDNLGAFGEMPQLANALKLSDQAGSWANYANVSFGVGNVGTATDNANKVFGWW